MNEQVAQRATIAHRVQCAMVKCPGAVTYLKLMKPKDLGELCAPTSNLASQTGVEKTNRSFDLPQTVT